MWCISEKPSAEFVFHMEDVLEVYHRPYNPKRPVVCLDETFKPGLCARADGHSANR